MIGCPENAPAPAEGAQAWVANPQPQAPGSTNTLCARLTLGGAAAAGAQVSAVVHFNYGDLKIGPATTGADGQAQIDFNIDKARNRFVVTHRCYVQSRRWPNLHGYHQFPATLLFRRAAADHWRSAPGHPRAHRQLRHQRAAAG